MLRKLFKKEEGFTLVEIIIVLAIVGLIFVIIFLAVQAAQRGQRDTARKDNVNRLVGQATQYAGNNNGSNFDPSAYTCATSPCTGAPWSATAPFIMNSPVIGIVGSSGTPAAGYPAQTAIAWVKDTTGGSTDACKDSMGTALPANGGTYAAVAVKTEDGNVYCKDY